jgi:molybdopterin-guanine dinucleotide biosynthesis protein A
MSLERPAGVILTGGKSSRMGVARKALIEFDGQPLLSRVTDRLKAHLEPLMLSCESENSDFDGFGLPVVPDLLPGYRGPLTGLCSALQYLDDIGHSHGLVLCPCDAPFVPHDLVQVMLEAGQGEKKPEGEKKSVVVISYQGVLQPTFSMWQSHHLPVIREALFNKNMGGLKRVLMSLPHIVVEWADAEPPPFFNVNTPADLKTAQFWLDRVQT